VYKLIVFQVWHICTFKHKKQRRANDHLMKH